MARRVPLPDEVADLSREQWEGLAASLCSLLFQAKRVEDRGGHGNGMDNWRLVSAGIEGFQHRRFNERLGKEQIRDLKENIATAIAHCKKEHRRALVKYHVVVNINLEPGHMGAPGEVARWNRFVTWARQTHRISVELLDLNWVHTRLLQFPHLIPDLFEDIKSDLGEVKQTLLQQSATIDALTRQIEQLVRSSSAAAADKAALEVLAREARVHYERGQGHLSQEQWTLAVEKYEDALRLVRVGGVDEPLRGAILTMLCGLEAVIGRLASALKHGEDALEIVTSDEKMHRLARGNIALAKFKLQKHSEADAEFAALLSEYEREGNLAEALSTLQHMTELACNDGNAELATLRAERLEELANALVTAQGGLTSLTIGAHGTAGNVLIAVSQSLPRPLRAHMLQRAVTILSSVEEMGSAVGSTLIVVKAQGARARAVWFLDQLDPAFDLYIDVIALCEREGFVKDAADARFNLGLLQFERGDLGDAQRQLRQARDRYEETGDLPSVANVDEQLARIAGSN